MSPWSRAHALLLLGAVVGGAAIVPARRLAAEPFSQTRVNADARLLADFKTRVDDYAALLKKLEATLPKLPTEATPQQIDSNQRNLAGLIAKARAKARPGDIFTPPMQTLARTLVARVFASTNSRTLRESIMDENPGPVTLVVNGRYPDAVPLASMPAEILKALPPLPEEIEYRFVGDTLILLDVRAHIVVDFARNALPR